MFILFLFVVVYDVESKFVDFLFALIVQGWSVYLDSVVAT